MLTPEERDEKYFGSLFEAIYIVAMFEGGDGSALVICMDKYNSGRFTYTAMADRFQKFLLEKKDYVLVDRFRDENHKLIAYDGVPKGKMPTMRYEHEYEGTKMVGFHMSPETAFIFQDGKSKVSRKSDDWHSIIVTI